MNIREIEHNLSRAKSAFSPRAISVIECLPYFSHKVCRYLEELRSPEGPSEYVILDCKLMANEGVQARYRDKHVMIDEAIQKMGQLRTIVGGDEGFSGFSIGIDSFDTDVSESIRTGFSLMTLVADLARKTNGFTQNDRQELLSDPETVVTLNTLSRIVSDGTKFPLPGEGDVLERISENKESITSSFSETDIERIRCEYEDMKDWHVVLVDVEHRKMYLRGSFRDKESAVAWQDAQNDCNPLSPMQFYNVLATSEIFPEEDIEPDDSFSPH